jgi:hypothetical protein
VRPGAVCPGVGGAGASRDRRQTGNLESLGFTRISRGLTGFSLGFAVCFFFVFLGFSRPNRDFSRGYGRPAARNFFSRPLPLSKSVKYREPPLFSMDGKGLDPGRAHDADCSRCSGFQREIAGMGLRFSESTVNSESGLCYLAYRLAETIFDAGYASA